jgi:hypothetical protein
MGGPYDNNEALDRILMTCSCMVALLVLQQCHGLSVHEAPRLPPDYLSLILRPPGGFESGWQRRAEIGRAKGRSSGNSMRSARMKVRNGGGTGRAVHYR